ncbi:MAG: serine hydrolase, partial [Bryobacteraceae bacterium]
MKKQFVLAMAIFCAVASAQTPGNARLDSQIKKEIQGFPGRVSLYAVNLDTGASYGIAADEPVRTASTIKLPIMVECFFEASQGKLK